MKIGESFSGFSAAVRNIWRCETSGESADSVAPAGHAGAGAEDTVEKSQSRVTIPFLKSQCGFFSSEPPEERVLSEQAAYSFPCEEKFAVLVERESEIPRRGLEIPREKLILQVLAAAAKAYQMHACSLGRSIVWYGNNSELNVHLGVDEKASQDLQIFYRRAGASTESIINRVRCYETVSKGTPPELVYRRGIYAEIIADPDIISCGVGHGVLDSQLPFLLSGDTSLEVHRAFSDGTSFLSSLMSDRALEEMTEKGSNVDGSISATVLGKSVQHSLPGGMKIGLRDVAASLLPEKRLLMQANPDSPLFARSLHKALILLSDCLKNSTPGISERDSYRKARDILASDFSRAMDFMDFSSSEVDLAVAMIRANQNDHGGEAADIYLQAFKSQGLHSILISEKVASGSLKVKKIASLPSMKLPEKIRNSEDFIIGGGFDMTSLTHRKTITAANDFLRGLKEALHISEDIPLKAARLYHNSRGETYINYSSGGNFYECGGSLSRVTVGFDRNGSLIHIASRAVGSSVDSFSFSPSTAPIDTSKGGYV
ncbi:MAG: hypothetical protein AB2L14_38005 [Candidatus Xenobiia bacterium LiM19]